MLKLIGQRVALGFATLVAVSLLIFWATELLPSDLPANILGAQATPEDVAAIRAELDLDRPAPQRYVEWLKGVLQGDLGRSLANRRPVVDVIGPRLGNTLFLMIYAAVIAVPLSVVLGTMAAVYRNSIYDKLVSACSLAAISMPEFLIGLFLILVMSAHLAWFPAIAAVKPEHSFFQQLHAAFLPMLTLILVVMAHMMRMTRASVLAVMSSAYIEMALLKGVSRRRIVLHHTLPNALAPIIGIVAVNLAYLMSGIVVVEAVFTFNGLGRMMVDATARHDIPVVQASGLIFAAVFIGLKLTADVLSILANPRLRHPR